MTPQGRRFTHAEAERLSRLERLVVICGRYEGVDERVTEALVTDEISIGDYVLSGGELPALVVLDAVGRGWCRASSATRSRWTAIRSCGACWIIRTTRGRRCFVAWRCPTC